MDIVAAKGNKGQTLLAKSEELRNRILSEIEKVLKSAEGERLLLLIGEGKNLSEKETQLVNLRVIILEAASRSLLTETGYQGSRLRCSCGCKAKFVRYDEKSFNLLVGRVDLKRALYHCQGCGRYWRPLDDKWELPPGHNSEGVERITALLGAYMPFETAEKVLLETSGVTLSDSSIRAISESIGAEMESIIEDEIKKSLTDALPEPKADVLAVFSDGAMVNTREEQWKEVKVGAIASFTRTGEKQLKLKQTTYCAYLGSVEDFKPRLWAEGYRRGAKGKEVTLFLGDGSPWVWNLADELFPHAIQALDYWHLCENVWKASHVLFTDEEAKRNWVEEITENMLRKGKLQEALDAVKSAPVGTKDARKAIETLVGYIENNQGRINYPALESKGYPIGSGIIESACKRIVGARHKQAGMRWSKNGVQKMLSLVSFIHSKRWEEYWKDLRKAS